jgi:hypothetical protein
VSVASHQMGAKVSPPHVSNLENLGLVYQDGQLALDGVLLTDLLEEFSSPLVVISEKSIHVAFLRLTGVLKILDDSLVPRVHVATGLATAAENARIYATVSESATLGLLRTLDARGVGFVANCISDLTRARHAGVSSKNIVFASILKTEDSFLEAERLQLGAIEVMCWKDLELLCGSHAGERNGVRVALRVAAPWCPLYLGLSVEEVWAAAQVLRGMPHVHLVGLSCGWDSCDDCSVPEYQRWLSELRILLERLQDSALPLEWLMVGPRARVDSGNASHMRNIGNGEEDFALATQRVLEGASFRVHFTCADALIRNATHVVGRLVRQFGAQNGKVLYLADLVVEGGDASSASQGNDHLVVPLKAPKDGLSELCEIWIPKGAFQSFAPLGNWPLGEVNAGDAILYPCSGLHCCVTLGAAAPVEILIPVAGDPKVIRARKREFSGFENEL